MSQILSIPSDNTPVSKKKTNDWTEEFIQEQNRNAERIAELPENIQQERAAVLRRQSGFSLSKK